MDIGKSKIFDFVEVGCVLREVLGIRSLRLWVVVNVALLVRAY